MEAFAFLWTELSCESMAYSDVCCIVHSVAQSVHCSLMIRSLTLQLLEAVWLWYSATANSRWCAVNFRWWQAYKAVDAGAPCLVCDCPLEDCLIDYSSDVEFRDYENGYYLIGRRFRMDYLVKLLLSHLRFLDVVWNILCIEVNWLCVIWVMRDLQNDVMRAEWSMFGCLMDHIVVAELRDEMRIADFGWGAEAMD